MPNTRRSARRPTWTPASITWWASGQSQSGKNCDAGAHQGGYTVNGGQPAGRLLCAPSITGTRFDWTDNAKLILSSLIDLEGSYSDMYQDWLIAGPN